MKRVIVRSAVILAPVLLLTVFAFPRLGSWLVVDDPLEKSDAILVLGGTRFERPLEAVDLYNAGWAPRVFMMRQIADYGERTLMERGIPYPREVDEQIAVMTRLGVPNSAITVLNEAGSTADEAMHLRELAERVHPSRVIVVTSKQHTRRARLVMRRRVADMNIKIIIRYSRYDRANTDQWWQERATIRFTLFESQRLLAYWLGIAD
ncbi:MAG TPA: YdcF family protein [Vicinamibacterales bacterium]